MNILAYTDGSCLANGRKDRSTPMGAGVRLVLPDGTRRDKARALGEGTNQRAELSAIILALEEIKAWCKEDNKGIYYAEVSVDIHTDSQYAIGCLSNPKWKPKANLDLIQQAKNLISEFESVTFTWVKGHAGTENNEYADRLAVSASLEKLSQVNGTEPTMEDKVVSSKVVGGHQ